MWGIDFRGGPTDSRGGLHHVCGMTHWSVWHLVPFRIPRTLAWSWDTSSSSRCQATCSTGRRYDRAIKKSNSNRDMSIGDTGVQEYRRYRSTGIQEYRITRCLVIIIMHMPGNTGVRCQVPSIRCYISCGKYSMSNTGVIYQVSNIAWQIPIYGIMCQI